jgi:hypothetical protein
MMIIQLGKQTQTLELPNTGWSFTGNGAWCLTLLGILPLPLISREEVVLRNAGLI